MRKAIALVLLSFMLVTCLIVSPVVYAQNEVSVYLNGHQICYDQAPRIISDRTFVPIRGVLEAAGATVSWDDNLKMTVAKIGDTIIWVGVDNYTMTVQKGDVTYVVGFEVAPCIIDNRTYVAVKSIADAFDIDVNWDPMSRRVDLTTAFPVDLSDYTTQSSTNIALDALNAVPAPNPSASVSDNYVNTDFIDMTGFTPPTSLNIGSSYVIKGDVVTNAILDRLNVKVTDVATGNVQINETQFNIDAASYSLKDIDARVKFGKLSAGEKLLEITAVTKTEARKKFSYNFSVVRPSGVTIDNPSRMLWPVPSSGLITTIFWCDNPFCHSNADRVNGHAALDIAANQNADVIAVQDGVVKKAGFGNSSNGNSGYGNFIQVDHGNGLITQYSHLYSIYVSPGDTVSAGQVIGGVGSTGNSTGNHLDFKIELNGKRCDPLYYLDMHPNVRCYESCDKPYFNKALSSRGLQ